MKCPFCGTNNIAGADMCDSCGEDLASIDREVPKTKIERFIMQEPISKVQFKNALSTSVDSNVLDAINVMSDSKTGCVLINDKEGKLKGILTERDILFKVLGKFKELSTTKVSEVMTPNVETLDDDDSLAYAMHKMSVNRFRHVPIMRKDQEPGVITALDLLRYLAKTLQ